MAEPIFEGSRKGGGGALRDVYTDEDMRILYGSNGKDFTKEYIYVMTRVK